MKLNSTIIAIILIIVSNITNAQSFVTVNKSVDNFTNTATAEDNVHPYTTKCGNKQIQSITKTNSAIGGTREIFFNGNTASCTDNKITTSNNLLNFSLNEAGNNWISTNVIYDANTTNEITINEKGMQLDLNSNNIKNAVFSLDLFNINSNNDIYVTLMLYSAADAYSTLSVKLGGKNFDTRLQFNADSLRKHGAASYPVDLNKIGAIRLMVRTKGNTQLSINNFTITTLQNKAFVETALTNTQHLNEVLLNWKNNTNNIIIASQTVEASINGEVFETINNNITSTSFTYIDKQQTYSQYRIKTVDEYGRITYSNTVKTNKLVFDTDVKVFPTVVTTTTTVLINSKEDNTISLQLLNTGGQLFLTKMLKVLKGINTFIVPIPSAAAGALFISTTNLKNNNRDSFKIVKQS